MAAIVGGRRQERLHRAGVFRGIKARIQVELAHVVEDAVDVAVRQRRLVREQQRGVGRLHDFLQQSTRVDDLRRPAPVVDARVRVRHEDDARLRPRRFVFGRRPRARLGLAELRLPRRDI